MNSFELGLYSRMEKYTNWALSNLGDDDAFADEFSSLWQSFACRKLTPQDIKQRRALVNFVTKVASLTNPPKDYIKVLSSKAYAPFIDLSRKDINHGLIEHVIKHDSENRHKLLSNLLLPKRFLEEFVDSTNHVEVALVAEHRNTDADLLYRLVTSETKTFISNPGHVNEFVNAYVVDTKLLLYILENNGLTNPKSIQRVKRDIISKGATTEEIRRIYSIDDHNDKFTQKLSSGYLYALFSSKNTPLDVIEDALNHAHKSSTVGLSPVDQVSVSLAAIKNENIPSECIFLAASNENAVLSRALQSVIYYMPENRVIDYIKKEYQLNDIPESFIQNILQWNKIMLETTVKAMLKIV